MKIKSYYKFKTDSEMNIELNPTNLQCIWHQIHVYEFWIQGPQLLHLNVYDIDKSYQLYIIQRYKKQALR